MSSYPELLRRDPSIVVVATGAYLWQIEKSKKEASESSVRKKKSEVIYKREETTWRKVRVLEEALPATLANKLHKHEAVCVDIFWI